jgi:hypothetical protein
MADQLTTLPAAATHQDGPLPSEVVGEADAPSETLVPRCERRPDVAEPSRMPTDTQPLALAPAACVRVVGAEVAQRAPLVVARSDSQRLHGLRAIHLGYKLRCEGNARGATVMQVGAGALLAELQAMPFVSAEVAVVDAVVARWHQQTNRTNLWQLGLSFIHKGCVMASQGCGPELMWGATLMIVGAGALVALLKARPDANADAATPCNTEDYWHEETNRWRRDLHAIDIAYGLFRTGCPWGIPLMMAGAEALIADLQVGRGASSRTVSPSHAESMQAGTTLANGTSGDEDALRGLRELVLGATLEPWCDDTVLSVPLAPDPTADIQEVPAPRVAGEAPYIDECALASEVEAPRAEPPPLLAIEAPRDDGQPAPAVEVTRADGLPVLAGETPATEDPSAPAVEAPCAERPPAQAVEAPRAEGQPMASRAGDPPVPPVEMPCAAGPPMPAVEDPCIDETQRYAPVLSPPQQARDPIHAVVPTAPLLGPRRASFSRARWLCQRRQRMRAVVGLVRTLFARNALVEAVAARLRAEGLTPTRPASAANETKAPATGRGPRPRGAVPPLSPALASSWTATPASPRSDASSTEAVPEPVWDWYNQDSAPIARRTYLELHRKGRIESKKVGKKVLVKREVLDAWIAAQGKPAPLEAFRLYTPTSRRVEA